MKPSQSNKNILVYVLVTYVLFGILLFVFGAVATYLLNGTPLAMRWVIVFTAWTPTLSLLILFQKFFPESSLKGFFKKAFSEKLNGRFLAVITLIQILIFVASSVLASAQNGSKVLDLLDFSWATISSGLFFTLFTGATGEEAGWRGYLLPAIVEKVGVVKGSLITSLIWAFWHAPAWFLGTTYTGLTLVKYIVVFVICITSIGFVMGICTHRFKNLLVPIIIHFTFNLLGQMFIGPMVDLVLWYAVFYFILAIGFYIWNKAKEVSLKTEDNGKMFVVTKQ